MSACLASMMSTVCPPPGSLPPHILRERKNVGNVHFFKKKKPEHIALQQSRYQLYNHIALYPQPSIFNHLHTDRFILDHLYL